MSYAIHPVKVHKCTDGDLVEFYYWEDVDLANVDAFAVYKVNESGESHWFHDAETAADAFIWLGQYGIRMRLRWRPFVAASMHRHGLELASACALSVLALED